MVFVSASIRSSINLRQILRKYKSMTNVAVVLVSPQVRKCVFGCLIAFKRG